MTPGQILLTASFAAITTGTIGSLSGGFDFSPLLSTGPIGLVCGWFMLRLERKLESLGSKFDRCTQAISHMLVQIPEVSEAAKKQLKEIMEQLEEERKNKAKE